MKKRVILTASSFLLGLILFNNPAHASEATLWEQYKSSFISKDGRIVDSSCDKCSHSEGQGYGMLLSIAYNDRATFDKLWQWTKINLRVRTDHLSAWQWGKRANGRWEAVDHNNATDGDILIALSLLKASRKWSDNSYKNESLKIIEDIRTYLAVTWQGHTFLLPGYYGFTKENGLVLNPSYQVYAAFSYFAQVDDKSFWDKVYKDSLFLASQNCFGMQSLPADWLILTDRVSIYTEKKPYLGYEAIRTLLYLASEKKPQFPQGLDSILDIYNKLGYIPLWIDLERESLSLKSAPGGFYAVYALAAKKKGDESLSNKLFKDARERVIAENNDYYSFSLYLLASSEDVF